MAQEQFWKGCATQTRNCSWLLSLWASFFSFSLPGSAQITFPHRSNRCQPHLTIRHQPSEQQSISWGLQSHQLNRQFKQAPRAAGHPSCSKNQRSFLRHATNSMNTSGHEKFSVDPSGFAEYLTGVKWSRLANASRHLPRPPLKVTGLRGDRNFRLLCGVTYGFFMDLFIYLLCHWTFWCFIVP